MVKGTAGWTISKFFSVVIFIALMVLFFFWIANQVTDLGLFFGFRTSHTVSADLAGAITSVGGVVGTPTVVYEIEPGVGDSERFKYDIQVSNKLVCVTSYLRDQFSSTTDCASHPYDIKEPVYFEGRERICLKIEKEIGEVEAEETETTEEEVEGVEGAEESETDEPTESEEVNVNLSRISIKECA